MCTYVSRLLLQVIVCIYAAAILTNAVRFVEYEVGRWPRRSRLDRNVTVVGCYFDFIDFFSDRIELYYAVHFWFRVVFVHVVPCLVLVLLNARLPTP